MATTPNYFYRGELAGTMGIDKDGKISATRKFKFGVDPYRAADLPLIMRDSKLPKRYSAFPGDSSLKCTDIVLGEMSEGDERSGVIVVQCNYTNVFSSGGGSTPPTDANPWDLPIQGYSYEPLDEVQPMLKAWDNTHTPRTKTIEVKNTAGDILLLNEWNGVMVLRFYYYIKDFVESWEPDYHNSVNIAPIAAAGKVLRAKEGKLRKFTAKPVYIYNPNGGVSKTYYQIDVEILHMPGNEWKIEALNAGTRLKINGELREIYTDGKGNYGAVGDGLTFTKKQLKDNEIQQVTTECRINEAGNAVLKPENDSHYREFEYKLMDWSTLAIPKTFRS